MISASAAVKAVLVCSGRNFPSAPTRCANTAVAIEGFFNAQRDVLIEAVDRGDHGQLVFKVDDAVEISDGLADLGLLPQGVDAAPDTHHAVCDAG